MGIRKLVLIATLLFASAQPARAEVGVGFFIGEPTGLDLKVDLNHKSALDFLFGWYSHYNDFDHGGYVHATWLYQPFVALSGGIAVPLRIGVGAAIALKMTVIDPDVDHPFVDLDGGLGVRFMF